MNARRLTLPSRPATAPPKLGDGNAPRVRLREDATPSAPPGGSPGARRLLQPLPLAGVALVLVALIGYWAVYSASTKRTAILVTTRALPAGTVISSGDVRTAQLAGEPTVLASLVPGRELAQTLGQRLSTGLPAGTPVPAGALATEQPQASAMTLAVPEFDVIGATLQAGDSVAVLATFGSGSGAASTRAVARSVRIVSVGEAPANTDPSTATVPVSVSVADPSIAASLALANEDAKLDLLLEGSGTATAPIPPASQGGIP